MLASEYGWAKDDIFNNTYLDEVLRLQDAIMARKYSSWMMDLAIAQNPHVDGDKQKELWQMLQKQVNIYSAAIVKEEVDVTHAMTTLKAAMIRSEGFQFK